MSNTVRMLRREILRILNDFDGVLAPHHTVVDHLRLTARPVPMLSEIEEALRKCESERWIVAVRGEIDGKPKWKITDQGRAVLLGE